MKFCMALLMCIPVLAQDELKFEDVISKIEKRNAPITALSAEVSFKIPQEGFGAGTRIGGRVAYSKGAFFQKQFAVWNATEGMLLGTEFAATDYVAYKSVFSGRREGAFFVAMKIDAAHGVPQNRGALELLDTFLGTEWMLADMALNPGKIKMTCKNVSVARKNNLIALTGKRSAELFGGQSSDINTTWYYNAETYRIEKAEFDSMGQKRIAVVKSYATVNGVELPSSVELEKGKGFLPLGAAEICITGYAPKLPEGLTGAPDWTTDIAMPFESNESFEARRNALAADPENPQLAISFCNAALARGMFRLQKEEGAEVFAALQKIKKESALLCSAKYCALISKGDEDGAANLLKQIAREKLDCPEVICLAASRQLTDHKYADALKTLSALSAEAEVGGVIAGMKFAAKTATAATAKELLQILEESCKGKDAAGKVDVVSFLEMPISARGDANGGVLTEKPDAFLAELVASEKPEAILLAARGYAHQSKKKEAAETFLKLAGNKDFLAQIKPELQAFAGEAKEESAKILDLIGDEITDVDLLVSLCDSTYAEKAKFEKLVRRLVSVLENEKKGDSTSYRWHDPKKIEPLLKKLMDENQGALAKQVLAAYIDRNNASSFLYGDLDLVKRVIGDDKDCAYTLVRDNLTSYSLERLSMTGEEVFEIIKKKLNSSENDVADFRALCSFVTDGSLRTDDRLKQAIPFIERAAKTFASNAEFVERLADAYVFANNLPLAIENYFEALGRGKEESSTKSFNGPRVAKPAYPPGSMQPRESDFQTYLPIIVKIVHVHLKNKNKDEAVRAVERFLKEFATSGSKGDAAEAFVLLEMPDRVVALKKEMFVSEIKEQKSKMYGYSEAVELGTELSRSYLESKKYVEAFVVISIALEIAKKVEYGQDQLKRAEELREQVMKVFAEEDMVRQFCELKFNPLPAEKEKLLKEALTQINDEDPDVREEATRKLREFGADAAPHLNDAVRNQGAEGAKRLKSILSEYALKHFRAEFEK